MEIADANIILRYLLKDDEHFFSKARVILEENNILLPFEVCAEVIYVLEKVYKVPRKNIHDALIILINYSNIALPDKSLLALNVLRALISPLFAWGFVCNITTAEFQSTEQGKRGVFFSTKITPLCGCRLPPCHSQILRQGISIYIVWNMIVLLFYDTEAPLVLFF